MLRIIVETCNAGMAANVGGSVERSLRTFDIDWQKSGAISELKELETFLADGPDQFDKCSASR